MKKLIFMIVLACTLHCSAEFRIWESTTGASVEAEYVGERGDKIGLRKRDGKTIYINPELLSDEDRTYAALQIPPKLTIAFDETKGAIKDPSLAFSALEEVVVTAELKKHNSKPYPGELTATFIFIGDNERSNNETLVKKEEQKFSIENKKTLTSAARFSSSKKSLIKTSHHSFEGYLLIITDPFGRVISKKSNPSSHARYAERYLSMEEGSELRKDGETVDLDSSKIERVEVENPKEWIYSMGWGDFGQPQKSPDGMTARIQTKKRSASLFHLGPQGLGAKRDRNPDSERVDIVVTFKLTEGKIGVGNAQDNAVFINVEDTDTHVLQVTGIHPNYTFLLDGAEVKYEQENNPARKGLFKLYAWVARKSRLEIHQLSQQQTPTLPQDKTKPRFSF